MEAQRKRGIGRARPLILALSGLLLIVLPALAHEEYLPPAPPSAQSTGPTLATVNGVFLTLRDYQDELERMPAQELAALTVRDLLEKAIRYELLRQEAIRFGFDQDSKLVELIEQMRAAYAKDQLDKHAVERMGDLLTDTALKKYYDEHPAEFTIGERAVINHLRLKNRAAAEAVVAKLKSGADVVDVAREFSGNLDGSVETLPPLSRGELPRELQDAVLALKQGEVSHVVEAAGSFHVFKLQELSPPTLKPFDQVKGLAKDLAIKRRLGEQSEELERNALVQHLIQYRDEAIAKLMLPPPDTPGLDVALATVGDHAITVRDFAHVFVMLDRADKEAARKNPKPFIRSLILEELRRQEGLRQGFGQDTAFLQYLERRCREYLIARVARRVIVSLPPVSEAALRRYYGAHQKEFLTPEVVHLSQIVRMSRKAAEADLGELKAGADFATLARERSDEAATKARGGWLGAVTRGQLSPRLEKAAFALKTEGLSSAIEDGGAFHILKVHRYYAQTVMPFDAVKGAIEEKLTLQTNRNAVERHAAELRRTAAIKLNNDEIAKLDPPSAMREKMRREQRLAVGVPPSLQ